MLTSPFLHHCSVIPKNIFSSFLSHSAIILILFNKVKFIGFWHTLGTKGVHGNSTPFVPNFYLQLQPYFAATNIVILTSFRCHSKKSIQIIQVSFCYHSDLIHMGLDYGEDIVYGTR